MTCTAFMSPMPESGSRFYGQVAPFPLPHLPQPCRGSCRAASAVHSSSPAGKHPEAPANLRRLLPHPLFGHAFPVGSALTGFPFAGPSLSGYRLLDLGRPPFPACRPGPASGFAAYRQFFYCCGTFSNLGAVGALVSVMFFGEKAIAIVALFRICEEMFYFGISFPVARRLGGGEGAFRLRSFRPDPVLLLILTALGLGLAPNMLGVPRPAPLGSVAAAAMLLATVLFLFFAIGLGLRLSRISCYAREARPWRSSNSSAFPCCWCRWPPWQGSAASTGGCRSGS